MWEAFLNHFNIDYFTLLGLTASVLMNGSALPQIFKILKTHKVEDLTIWREIPLLIGCSLYLLYGIHRKDIIIILSNIWATMMFLTLIYLIKKYKK